MDHSEMPMKPETYEKYFLKQCRDEFGTIGPTHSHYMTGASCCLSCKRYIVGSYRNMIDKGTTRQKNGRVRKPALPPSCCEFCGRTPLDEALIKYGVMTVMREKKELLEGDLERRTEETYSRLRKALESA